MRIDIEYVLKLQAERKKINELDLSKIEWYEDGKKVKISPKVIEGFKFTGLCNTDFITMDIFKKRSL